MRATADQLDGPARGRTPRAFLRLSTLWIQITGTWCNLKCVHCINASGPVDPWLKPVSPEVVRRAIRDAEDDDTDPETNDRVRGADSFSKAVAAIVMLNDRGLLPFVTATEIASAAHAGGRDV